MDNNNRRTREAARQAAYRARVRAGMSGIAAGTDDPGQGARRVSLTLPTNTILALRRLARHNGITLSQMAMGLISSAEDELIGGMDDAQLEVYLRPLV